MSTCGPVRDLYHQLRQLLVGKVVDVALPAVDEHERRVEVATRFRHVRTALGTSEDETELRRLWAGHDDLPVRIRRHAGFSRFLLPPDIDELCAASGDGAVVLVDVARHRADAVVVTSRTGPLGVPLPDLTIDDAAARAEAMPGARPMDADAENHQLQAVLPETPSRPGTSSTVTEVRLPAAVIGSVLVATAPIAVGNVHGLRRRSGPSRGARVILKSGVEATAALPPAEDRTVPPRTVIHPGAYAVVRTAIDPRPLQPGPGP